MNVTHGIVRAVEGGEALVEVVDAGCGHCNEDGGCGGKADLTCRGPRRYRVDNDFGASIGETVSIAVDDGVIFSLATRAYAIPLLAMVFGAVLASALAGSGGGEGLTIAGALAGLLVGWFIAARIRVGAVAKPRILSRN